MLNVKMNSSNTIQGGNFLNNKNKYNNKNVKLIEGNDNMANDKSQEINRLVQEYRGLVDKYEMNYEQFVYEKMNTESNISELFGKVVQYPKEDTGKLYFVTQRGVRREIPRTGNVDNLVSEFVQTEKYKSHECGVPQIINGTQFRALKEGLPLKTSYNSNSGHTSQKCNDPWVIDGSKLLKDRVSHNIGWIDDLGNLYEFTDPNNKHPSCGEGADHQINGQQWGLISKKTNPLTKVDVCPSQTQPLQLQLNKDNNRMLTIANEIKTIVDDMKIQNTGKDAKIIVGSNNFQLEKTRLLNKRKKIESLEKEIFSLEGNIRDNTFGVKSVNLNYLAWGVSFVTIAGIGFMISRK